MTTPFLKWFKCTPPSRRTRSDLLSRASSEETRFKLDLFLHLVSKKAPFFEHETQDSIALAQLQYSLPYRWNALSKNMKVGIIWVAMKQDPRGRPQE
jgi:hypothetical protein